MHSGESEADHKAGPTSGVTLCAGSCLDSVLSDEVLLKSRWLPSQSLPNDNTEVWVAHKSPGVGG